MRAGAFIGAQILDTPLRTATSSPQTDPGREAALAWMERSFQLGVVSSLPRDEDGNVIWKLAGPMMFRELPTITFAIIYATGMAEGDAEILAKQILNEWHGLERNAGLESEFGPADLKEAK